MKRSCIVLVLALLAPASAVHSQTSFPVKPVRMIVAFTPGSETDYFARIVGQKLGERWGQQVVIDNRTGAGGVLASALVASAAGDGYTLFTHSMAHAITPAVYAKLPYDTRRDFAAVSKIAGVPNVLVVTPGQGLRSVKDLIALAKQKPGQITFGSAGVGSGMHINGEQFRLVAGINVVHVPYKGGPEALNDLQGGRIQFVFSPIGLALPLVRDKRLLALAVSTSARTAALPDVPTVAEAALPGFDFDTWYGLFAPGTTPGSLVARISADVRTALAASDVADRIAARGAVLQPSTPEAFERFVRADVEKLARIVKAAGVKAQ